LVVKASSAAAAAAASSTSTGLEVVCNAPSTVFILEIVALVSGLR